MVGGAVVVGGGVGGAVGGGVGGTVVGGTVVGGFFGAVVVGGVGEVVVVAVGTVVAVVGAVVSTKVVAGWVTSGGSSVVGGIVLRCGGGLVAGFALAVLASLSGGAAGPGRMRFVGPFTRDVLVHSVTACGIGALLGAAVLAVGVWRSSRTSRATLSED